MNIKIRTITLTLLFVLLFNNSSFSQQSGNDWFHIPGFTPDIPTTLTSEGTFYGVIGAAALSYVLAEFVFKCIYRPSHATQFGQGMPLLEGA